LGSYPKELCSLRELISSGLLILVGVLIMFSERKNTTWLCLSVEILALGVLGGFLSTQGVPFMVFLFVIVVAGSLGLLRLMVRLQVLFSCSSIQGIMK